MHGKLFLKKIFLAQLKPDYDFLHENINIKVFSWSLNSLLNKEAVLTSKWILQIEMNQGFLHSWAADPLHDKPARSVFEEHSVALKRNF